MGSQVRAPAPADPWSDLDVIIFHTDPPKLIASTDWIRTFGTVVLSVVEETAVLGGKERRVLYSDGRDVDFSVFPSVALGSVTQSPEAMEVLGRGCEVVLDKDGLVTRLPTQLASRATLRPGPPGEEEFQASIADFWYHVQWPAKKLRRGEVWAAKIGCDSYLKRLLPE